MTMPMLTHPTTTSLDPALARPGEPFRVRLAAALAETSRDGRPLTDRASAPTHRYRAMA
jgi:hypothetical protein